jgi:peptide/nickel transport system permease protein
MLTEAALAPAAGLGDSDYGGTRPRFSTLRSAGHTFLEHRMAVVGLGFLLFVVLFCFVGPLLYKTNQVSANVVVATLPPSGQHWLGTDENGFDVLGRLMLGGQTSLEVGLGAAIVGASMGVVWGSVAGFCGGVIDSIMMRVVDAVLALPALLLLLVLAVIIQPSVPMLIIIVGVVSWLVPARLVRGETLTLKTREYVDASRVVGASRRRTVARHILPNVLGTIIVNATFQVADAIILVAYLSFLGLGISPPATNWGAMLSDGLNYALSGYWWLIFPPGVTIVLTVVAVNYVGDGLRDAFEVRLRVR